MRGGRQDFGRDWRSTAARYARLRFVPRQPGPETTHQKNSCSSLIIIIILFLALLINYDCWKCLRDIGTEGQQDTDPEQLGEVN
jgi:hypothetical protein